MGKSPYKEKFFVLLLENLRKRVLDSLPDELKQDDSNTKEVFVEAFANYARAHEAHKDAVAALTALENIPEDAEEPAQEGDLDMARVSVESTHGQLNAESKALLQSARPCLKHIQQLIDQVDQDALVISMIISHGKPKKLAKFCKQGEEEGNLIQELLNDTSLMKDMLLAGGAKEGRYGPAMQIYTRILKKQDKKAAKKHKVLRRLALATALELAEPILELDTEIEVEPLRRYLHYQVNYLHGEFDPVFSSLSTWELRHVVNSDAPDSQLSWGRAMLRNYRPDQCILEDYQWRYCQNVETDVLCQKTEWTSRPKTYPQILAGGGKAGPRAWYARFLCKAFGIPTWGVRQENHSALAHWTPDGWCLTLTDDWEASSWDDRSALDFLLETQAREQFDDYTFVAQLEWMAEVMEEEPADPETGWVQPQCYWRSLAYTQTRILAKETTGDDEEEVDKGEGAEGDEEVEDENEEEVGSKASKGSDAEDNASSKSSDSEKSGQDVAAETKQNDSDSDAESDAESDDDKSAKDDALSDDENGSEHAEDADEASSDEDEEDNPAVDREGIDDEDSDELEAKEVDSEEAKDDAGSDDDSSEKQEEDKEDQSDDSEKSEGEEKETQSDDDDDEGSKNKEPNEEGQNEPDEEGQGETKEREEEEEESEKEKEETLCEKKRRERLQYKPEDVASAAHGHDKHRIETKVEKLIREKVKPEEVQLKDSSEFLGMLVMAATATEEPSHSTEEVQWMKSFDGDMQMFVKKDFVLRYIIWPSLLKVAVGPNQKKKKYNFTCQVSVVHANQKPIKLQILKKDSDKPKEHMIDIPYTMGAWASTKPVVIELSKKKTTFTILREDHIHGFAIKNFKLSPVAED